MEKMGLPYRGAFTKAAAFIHEAGWSLLSGISSEEQKKYQERLAEFRPSLHELGVLQPFPDRDGLVRLRASEVVWPGASGRQASDRLLPAINAIIENRLSNLTKLTALAAARRKPVGNELEYLPEIVLDPQRCTTENGQVLEGEMMRGIWGKRSIDYGSLLRYVRFSVITTDQVPPEALHARPTGLATLAAWWHLNPNPRRVAITSIAPYGYRFWCEASEHFPECSWELLAPVPAEPLVVGAISEVGKIVYNLAKSMA